MFAKSLGIHPLDPGRKDREGLIAPEPGEEAKKGPAWGGTGQSAPQLPRSLSLSSGGPKLQTGQGMCSYSVAVTAGCREGHRRLKAHKDHSYGVQLPLGWSLLCASCGRAGHGPCLEHRTSEWLVPWKRLCGARPQLKTLACSDSTSQYLKPFMRGPCQPLCCAHLLPATMPEPQPHARPETEAFPTNQEQSPMPVATLDCSPHLPAIHIFSGASKCLVEEWLC